MQVVSVGYERRSIDEFIRVLLGAGVTKLIDIRQVALSRRVEYRKGPLERALAAVGIEYLHLAQAGNPYRKEIEDLDACLAAYRRHVKKHPGILDDVRAEMSTQPVAVLCYERAHDECHRSVLLEAMQVRGDRLEVRLLD